MHYTYIHTYIHSYLFHDSLAQAFGEFIPSQVTAFVSITADTKTKDVLYISWLAYTHTYIHTCPNRSSPIQVYTHTYIHTCIHTYIRINLFFAIACLLDTKKRTYVHKYVHKYIHIYIHTTYIHKCILCLHTCILCLHTLPYFHIKNSLAYAKMLHLSIISSNFVICLIFNLSVSGS